MFFIPYIAIKECSFLKTDLTSQQVTQSKEYFDDAILFPGVQGSRPTVQSRALFERAKAHLDT
jgi:hypothetical protein